MRRSGAITAETIEAVLDAVRPGVTTADLDAVAERRDPRRRAPCRRSSATGASPATICASMNDEIVHGIPSHERVLREGDLLSLDFGAIWEGFHSDSAVTVFVGGQAPSEEAARLVKVTEECARCRDRGDPARAAASPTSATRSSRWPSRPGFGIVREYGGHGIGRALHEDPFIQNCGPPGRGPDLRPGLVSRSSRC